MVQDINTIANANRGIRLRRIIGGVSCSGRLDPARLFAPDLVTRFVSETERMPRTVHLALIATFRDALPAYVTGAATALAHDRHPAHRKESPISQPLTHALPQGIAGKVAPARDVPHTRYQGKACADGLDRCNCVRLGLHARSAGPESVKVDGFLRPPPQIAPA